MIEKKTVIDQIEITRSGSIQIRLGLLLVEDGEELSCQWHRTVIEPDGDIDVQIAAVNVGLAAMRAAPVSDVGRVALLKSLKPMVHTPEVIQAFTAKRRAASEAEAAIDPK